MHKHFTFSDRVTIQYLIESYPRCSASFIANQLNKTRAAVYYELKNNVTRVKTKKESFKKEKDDFNCATLKKFPFCCNACPKLMCSHRSLIYNAYDAQDKARKTLVNSRINTKHRKFMIDILDEKVSPLILNGLSIDVALNTLGIKDVSSSTVRRYINKGLLTVRRIDLPSAVRFKVKDSYRVKSSAKISPRVLYKRTYDDFLSYIEANPKSIVVQLDSLIGKLSDKTAILTIYFNNSKFQFAFKYTRRNSDINNIIANLYDRGIELGYKLFDVILTDNGSEFKGLIDLENNDDGVFKFKVFYCDPYRSYQKAECERNHGLIRRIIKKGKSIDLISQFELDMTMSNINSYPRGSLEYRTPYTLFEEEYSSIILDLYNIIKIETKNIKLK